MYQFSISLKNHDKIIYANMRKIKRSPKTNKQAKYLGVYTE